MPFGNYFPGSAKFEQSSSANTYFESDLFPVESGQKLCARFDLYQPRRNWLG